jgi:hypothetical protein
MGTLRGRIAQLVELLSYTQVVIGSSPVAPIYPLAGVVQSVRALACHARSCGFESRLSRNKALLTKAPFLYLYNFLLYNSLSDPYPDKKIRKRPWLLI